MVLNYIWIFLILVGILTTIIKFIYLLNTESGIIASTYLSECVTTFFEKSNGAVNFVIGLAGILILWSGLMRIAQDAGCIHQIARLLNPLLRKIFPGIPENHPAQGAIVMNLSANMLGLDNAATPLGLKAMEHLQELNTNKAELSKAQLLFIVLNTAGLTLLPTTIMAARAAAGATDATDIFLPTLITTSIGSLFAFLVVSYQQKISLLNKTIMYYLCAGLLFMLLLILPLFFLNTQQIETYTKSMSAIILSSFLVWFLIAGLIKKLNVFNSFIEGAKEGIQTVVKILPFLIAMFCAIGIFSASGALVILVQGLQKAFFISYEVSQALLSGLLRPLSASASKAYMLELFTTTGVNSMSSRIASVIQGSSETTFYVIAIYCGSVGIKNTKNALFIGLLADLVALIVGIIICLLYF